MGSSASVPKDKKVVIIGGGYAGSSLALKLLNAGADVTLIDPKSYFYHNIGTVRAAVDPSTWPVCMSTGKVTVLRITYTCTCISVIM